MSRCSQICAVLCLKMAGRLRILPHKSWHVWTTENIDKVKRDERLHKEEIERAAVKSRDVKSEQLLSQLLRNHSASSRGRDSGESDSPRQLKEKKNNQEQQHAPRDDARVNRHADNAEHKREKDEKELLRKKQEGSAPFQLVPDEFTKQKPWYLTKKSHKVCGSGYKEDSETPAVSSSGDCVLSSAESKSILSTLLRPHSDSHSKSKCSGRDKGCSDGGATVTSRGRRLHGKEAVLYMDRDKSRKDAADPMAHFLPMNTNSGHPLCSSEETAPTTRAHPLSSSAPTGETRLFQSGGGSDDDDDTHRNGKRKHVRGDKKASRHKRKKEGSHRDRDRDRDRDRCGHIYRDIHQDRHQGRNHNKATMPAANVGLDPSVLHALRQKRLLREKDAQVKSALLQTDH